jgi:dTDP-4-dehydrorhamnose reductase
VYLILRTAWVYSLRRDSFVTKVLKWARENETLRIVDDQISNPTWARMLAEITGIILARGLGYIEERKGLYHLAGGGYASRLEWSKEIIALDPKKAEQKVRRIESAKTADFPTPAKRPLFSALNCELFSKKFRFSMTMWENSLGLAMAQ